MPTILITGISGYIGGHIIDFITRNNPNWQLITLVRTETQAQVVRKSLPTVRVVVGNFGDHTILAGLGARADVILQLVAYDNANDGESIIKGMSLGKKGYYIHVSRVCTLQDISNGYGKSSDKIYNDSTGLDSVAPFGKGIDERSMTAVTAAGVKYGISTVIACLAAVYGVGRGLLRQRSTQLPFLIEAILKRGKGFTVHKGENITSSIHIDDVASAFTVIIKDALIFNTTRTSRMPATYYFLETAEQTWAQVTQEIVKEAHGRNLITTTEIEQLTPGQAAQIHPWAPLLWGGNCRARASRLLALGWVPNAPPLGNSLREMMDFEIEYLSTQNQVYLGTWRTDVERLLGDNISYS